MSDSIRKQVIVNLGFTLLKSVFVLLSFRLADMMLSAHMMGMVLLFRRQGALWSNLAQLGFSQVLLKFYVSSDSQKDKRVLWTVLLRWLAVIMLVILCLCVIFAPYINPWLFPDSSPSVTSALGLYVIAMAFGFLANSSWLSEFRFVEANLIDWLHGSLLFVICLIIGNELDMVRFSWLLGGLSLAASLLSLWFFARWKGYQSELVNSDWFLGKNERNYGFSRALTAYADMATMVVGPWFLRETPVEAAQLIAAYTVLRIAQTLVLPVAQVLALRANSHFYEKSREEHRILLLNLVVFIFSWIGVAFYYIIGGEVISIWLPNLSAGVIKILDELIPFMPAVCMFYGLRNHIDLKFHQPWNLIVLVCCILVFPNVALSIGDNMDAMVAATKYMCIIFYLYSIVFCLLFFVNCFRDRSV